MINKTTRDIKWRQDISSVTIDFELKRTSLKKITLVVGRRFVRVTCPEKSYAKVIDLHGPVVFASGAFKSDYTGDVFTVELKKESKGLWDGLWVEGLSREDTNKRRQEDIEELEEIERRWHEEKSSVKVEQASMTTKEKMKIEDERRNKIDQIKETEKQNALSEIFNEEKQIENVGISKVQQTKASKKENEIWGDDEVKDKPKQQGVESLRKDSIDDGKEEEKPAVERVVPSVRNVPQKEPIKLEFTDRLFPTLALRESQIKEAPAPKLRKLAQKLDKNAESTLKSPIWLKDKGDEFLQGGDYSSAIDAYNSALKLDPTYWIAFSNRSICYLKLHNLKECAADCSFLLNKFMELEKDEKMTFIIKKLREKVYLRLMACHALEGEFKKFKELAELLLQESILSEESKKELQVDFDRVCRREEMLQKKKLVDDKLKKGEYEVAESDYQILLNEDEGEKLNERLFSNLSLCQFKLEKYQACVESCSEAIRIVESRVGRNLAQADKSKQNEYYKGILIKIYYRRSQCLIQLENQADAEKDLRSILLLDERNQEARTLKKSIEQKRQYEQAISEKTSGDSALKEGKHSKALEHYRQATAMLDPNEKPLEYLSTLLNMTVCHTAIDQTDEIISDCIKGLRVAAKFNKAVIKLEKSRFTREEQEKLNQLELRFYMRKGNAFLKKGQ